ncbi:hypothetical protein KAM471c_42670 (plasmid) [Aeromonas caviae]|nr:hypothetical protein KAM471c_42670 [Aeromonas caviae]
MAIFHLAAKTGSRGGGQSAKAKADYIQREGKYARDKDEVLHTQAIMGGRSRRGRQLLGCRRPVRTGQWPPIQRG